MAQRLTIATFKAAKKALREDRRKGILSESAYRTALASVEANERAYIAERKGKRK